MANIFSGMFTQGKGGGGGNAAAKMAKYNYELDDYGKLMERYRRAQDLADQDEAYKRTVADMSPERQRQMNYARIMAGGLTTGDKGMEAMGKSQGQFGGTIADEKKQNKTTVESIARGLEDTKQANLRHQYKVDNPTVEEATESSKIQVAKAYIGSDEEWARLQRPENRVERQQVMRDAWRDRQLVDTETGYADAYSGEEVITKNLLEAGVTKARIPFVTESVQGFRKNVRNAELVLRNSTKQLDRVRYLHENVGGNTGWWSALKFWPGGEAKTWSEVRDSVISNVGLDKLMELKAGSSAGATGLGALNEKELEMLQKHKGSLEAAQSEKQLKEVLESMADDIANFQRDTMVDLETGRNDYKTNAKKYFGMSDEEVNFIPKSQEYLFTGGAYEPQKFANPLAPKGDGSGFKILSVD